VPVLWNPNYAVLPPLSPRCPDLSKRLLLKEEIPHAAADYTASFVFRGAFDRGRLRHGTNDGTNLSKIPLLR
jgi:hypothetical protein